MGITAELGIFKKSMKYYKCALKKQKLSHKDAFKVAYNVIERDAGKEAAIGAGLGTALFVPIPVVPTLVGTTVGYGLGRTINVSKNSVVGSYVKKALLSVKKFFSGGRQVKDVVDTTAKNIDEIV